MVNPVANVVALNNVLHKNVKINTRYSEQLGNNLDRVLTCPTEFVQIQREYPIFFQKHPETGKFQSIALLGIEPGENLYLQDNKWNASYVPAIVTSNPFVIGFEDQTAAGGSEYEPVIYINMDSPRVNETEGEMVFLEFGGNTHYLEKVTRNLKALYQGLSISDNMFALFSEYNLIEPVKLEFKVHNKLYRLTGNYSINSERLAALDGNALAALNNAGVLDCAFFVAASLNNVQKLIDIKNTRG